MSKEPVSAGFLTGTAHPISTLSGPPVTGLAAMAARVAASAESSYTESVIDGLVATILDERLDSLERAEAVVALKSYLQTDWDSVAKNVGVSGRSLQVIAGIIKLRESFKESLRLRRIGLRHGAALVRLGEHDSAVERLHAHLLQHPDIGGEEALRMAGILVREPDLDPELARLRLSEDARRRTLLRGMSESDASPYLGAGLGLRSALTSLTSLDASALTADERQQLARDLAAAMATIERVQQDLDSAE